MAGADPEAMRKLITLTLAVLLVGLFAAVVFAAVETGDDSSSTVGTTETSPTTETTETTTTDDDGTADRGRDRDRDRGDRREDDAPAGGVDVSGPCDEAEHANDPRCGGTTAPAPAQPQGGVDISGPCDEAEHANDPRCTGVTPRVEDDDAPGHDRGDDHGDDRDEGERHDNSGPGNGDDDAEEHDNSGPGNGDDDSRGDDDHSGHGRR
jgi:hypothetical protein